MTAKSAGTAEQTIADQQATAEQVSPAKQQVAAKQVSPAEEQVAAERPVAAMAKDERVRIELPANLAARQSLAVADEKLAEHLKSLHTTLLEAEDEPSATGLRLLDSAPPWLVSMVLHMLVLIVLGVWVIVPLEYGTVSIVMDPTTTESGEPWMPDAGPIPTLEMSATDTQQSIQGEANNTESFTTPKPPEIALEQVDSQNSDSGDRSALKGRQGTSKRALLLAYGGTEDTEAAVRRGLEWLARQQRPDGQWSL